MMDAAGINKLSIKKYKKKFMMHFLRTDFIMICDSILKENKTLNEWSLIESDDMFQQGNYIGGFDSTEMEFCFSVFEEQKEYWFQLSLEEINKVSKGDISEVEVRIADF